MSSNRHLQARAGARRAAVKIRPPRSVDRGMRTAFAIVCVAALAAGGCNAITGIERYHADDDSLIAVSQDARDVDVVDSGLGVDQTTKVDGLVDSGLGVDQTEEVDGLVDDGPIDAVDAVVDDGPSCGAVGYVFSLPSYPPPAGSCDVCCLKKCTIDYSSGGKHFYICCSGCASY